MFAELQRPSELREPAAAHPAAPLSSISAQNPGSPVRTGTQLRRRHDEWTETISLPQLKVDDNQDKCLLLIPHHCQKFGDVAFSPDSGGSAVDKVTREQERINGSFIMFCP